MIFEDLPFEERIGIIRTRIWLLKKFKAKRERTKLTIKDAAKQIGISGTQLGFFEKEKSLLTNSSFEKILNWVEK